MDHTIEFYPAHHGFVVADHDTYDEQAAERHWAALRDLYAARPVRRPPLTGGGQAQARAVLERVMLRYQEPPAKLSAAMTRKKAAQPQAP